MELNDYQKKAMMTCMPSSENYPYMILNLLGEVGEFMEKSKSVMILDEHVAEIFKPLLPILEKAGKTAKDIRKGNIKNQMDYTPLYSNKCPESDLMKEAGDILWQLSGLCSVMGWSLGDIAQQNIDKLSSRQSRGVIDGSGDNR